MQLWQQLAKKYIQTTGCFFEFFKNIFLIFGWGHALNIPLILNQDDFFNIQAPTSAGLDIEKVMYMSTAIIRLTKKIVLSIVVRLH